MLRQVSSSHNSSTFVEHKPCPACRETGGDRAGDNLAVYSDGHGYCNACGHYEKKVKHLTIYLYIYLYIGVDIRVYIGIIDGVNFDIYYIRIK